MHWPILIRRVVGHSMTPTLLPGQLVIVRVGLAPRIGDIVVAHHNGREVIKRVADVNAREARLIGDNHAHGHNAGWIKKEQVVGRAYIRGLRRKH